MERKQNGDTIKFIQAVGLGIFGGFVFRGTFYKLHFNDCSVWNAVSI